MTKGRFSSRPIDIRVPFFLLFGLSKGTPQKWVQKDTTGRPGATNTLLKQGIWPQGNTVAGFKVITLVTPGIKPQTLKPKSPKPQALKP